ncbi:DUF1173 family protein [Nocardia sp. NBC_00511]|uniref:DUF1173 family protein n=1 Tax=Nocardia sp. NBC_00511 TaxID=2903591 RepID=UPI002F911DE4
MARIDRVRLAAREVRLADVRANPDRYARTFITAKTIDGHALCLCQPEPLRLVIRCRGGRYFLARWPGEGQAHHHSCPFHQIDPALSGRGAYADDAIVEGPEGTSIRFDTPLLVKPATTVSETDPRATDSVSGGRCTVGLLGLLHYLWEDAHLNAYSPGQRRGWPQIRATLESQMQDCVLSRHALAEVLYLVPPYRPETADANRAAFAAFLTGLRSPREQVRRGLLLGELTEATASAHSVAYKVKHLPRTLYASHELHQRILRSHRHAFARAASQHGGHRIALFLIERSPKGYASVADAAVMLTTGDTYIPADSSHELVMANALQAAHRAYFKPVRYDHTSLVLPDFVLTDVENTVVEVWGLDTPEYLRRKAIKVAQYAATDTTLIGWRPDEPLPDLHRPAVSR